MDAQNTTTNINNDGAYVDPSQDERDSVKINMNVEEENDVHEDIDIEV